MTTSRQGNQVYWLHYFEQAAYVGVYIPVTWKHSGTLLSAVTRSFKGWTSLSGAAEINKEFQALRKLLSAAELSICSFANCNKSMIIQVTLTGNKNHRTIESLRLERTFKIKSNHKPNTKLCPRAPHLHILLLFAIDQHPHICTYICTIALLICAA